MLKHFVIGLKSARRPILNLEEVDLIGHRWVLLVMASAAAFNSEEENERTFALFSSVSAWRLFICIVLLRLS